VSQAIERAEQPVQQATEGPERQVGRAIRSKRHARVPAPTDPRRPPPEELFADFRDTCLDLGDMCPYDGRMPETVAVIANHDAPAEALTEALTVAPPLAPAAPAPHRSPAEEARTLVATTTLATLSTLSEFGDPWGSLVTYATVGAGEPVLLVSTLAEHGRNLHRDPRASLVITEEARPGGDPLNSGRVTLAGRAERPTGDEAAAARAAFLAAVPMAHYYSGFGDFSLWVLRIDRVRWVGGYGRMDSCDASEYAAAEPDPVASAAVHAVEHLNADHADVLLLMAQTLAGYTDATAARCDRADRYGLDLTVTTPRGKAPTRVGFAEPVTAPDGLRAASVELTRRARAA
jgi:putative heme iron utilization protein